MKKQGFNLVEIILALGVIAVGMTGVLVLFPTGLNAVNSATADNSAPDAVQYLAGYIESRIRGDWRNGVNTTVSGLPTTKPAATSGYTFEPEDGWTQVKDPTNETNKLPIYTSATNGLFKYEQIHTVNGEAVSDFAAAARVWKTNNNHIHVPGQSAPVKMNTGSVTIFIEVSYPLTKPYDEREMQTYRFDLYDYGA